MKKGLIAAGLLVSLSGTAQDVSTYTPGTMGEGVVYYLPKTEIELQVTATKVVYTPGEFCQYADRYLRLTGISSQPEEHWEINSIKVNSIGIPDPDNAYAVKLKDKSAASQVELTPEGIIKAINTTSPIEKAPVTKVADTVKKRIDPRSFTHGHKPICLPQSPPTARRCKRPVPHPLQLLPAFPECRSPWQSPRR